ncbi:MAG: hypothetical protein PSX80_16875 [bacterium]|nr:hypothetical protein [bacterium]
MIVRLYRDGTMTVTSVAEACGVSHQTAGNVLRRFGIETSPRAGERRWRKHLDEIVRRYVAEGRTMQEIAEIVELSSRPITVADKQPNSPRS